MVRSKTLERDRRSGLCRAGLGVLFCALLGGAGARAQTVGEPASAAQGKVQGQAGSLSGTVVDADGDAIAGAQVKVSGPGLPERTQVADIEGYFKFAAVPAGELKLTVESAGFGTVVKTVTVHAAEDLETANVVLPVASALDDVDVSPAKQYAMAEAEMKIEETQRLGYIVPNFYVTYNWHAPPLTAGQKYRLAFRATIDPANFGIAAIIAGVEQETNTFSGYGPGPQGYGKRFGAALADGTVGNMLGGAVFPVLLKQDPRYFYKGTGSILSRALYAISTAVICRGDNGHWQPNYSSVLGDVSAGAVSNLYYPASDRNGALLTIENGLLNAAEDGVGNLLQEFVFKHITPGTKP